MTDAADPLKMTGVAGGTAAAVVALLGQGVEVHIPQLTVLPSRDSVPVYVRPLSADSQAPIDADAMADAALTKQVQQLGDQVETLVRAVSSAAAPSIKPWWKRVDGVGSVVGATVGVAALATVIFTALGLDHRMDSLETEIHRLDDRLTPAIDRLTAAVSELDKRLSIDEATTEHK